MPESRFKRPAGIYQNRNDPEDQYRAGYQHGAYAVLKELQGVLPPNKAELSRWIEIELQKWRHDINASPEPPKLKRSQ